jgi:hypothetical protein
MDRPTEPSGIKYLGIPRSPGALLNLLGTSLLAGAVCAMFGGGVALFVGLSPVIAGGVSGIIAAVVVGLAILRYGPAA